MPPANNIAFPVSKMVTSTVGVQTSCPNSPTYSDLYGQHDDGEDICPKHFTDIHRCKLEDTFSKRQKPDEIQLQIIAMECNLLYKDVRDWFRKRRLKWMDDLVRTENNSSSKNSRTSMNSSSSSCSNDANNNNTLQKKANYVKNNISMDHNKGGKHILVNNNMKTQQDVST